MTEHPPLTKILATIGPASEDDAVLSRLVEAGATLFRLNFSHGDFASHEKRLAAIRRVAAKLNKPLAILGDLQGPKIRVGPVPDPGIELSVGQDVVISAAAAESRDGPAPILATTYPAMVDEVKPGQRVLINDGAIRMLAMEQRKGPAGAELVCRVKVGGLVTSKKGINLPDSVLSVPALSDRDWECAKWAVEHDLDFLALSFVRSGADVRHLASRLATLPRRGSAGDPTPMPIIAKIETPQAVAAIDEILISCEAIMVARGDLGVEMDLAKVPMVQKKLVARAHDYGKPCIVATQMLESMISAAQATRAEVSDVANAILDGADAVMLSGETAVGKYPVLAVETMRRVALETEAAIREMPAVARPPSVLQARRELVPALAHGAWTMAQGIGAQLVAVWTQTGGTARHLSRNGFRVPILAFSTDASAVRRMNLLYAVIPVLQKDFPKHRFEFATIVEKEVLENEWAEPGDRMVLLAGYPFDRPGGANTVALRVVGDISASSTVADG